jgi:hypothetical protein
MRGAPKKSKKLTVPADGTLWADALEQILATPMPTIKEVEATGKRWKEMFNAGFSIHAGLGPCVSSKGSPVSIMLATAFDVLFPYYYDPPPPLAGPAPLFANAKGREGDTALDVILRRDADKTIVPRVRTASKNFSCDRDLPLVEALVLLGADASRVDAEVYAEVWLMSPLRQVAAAMLGLAGAGADFSFLERHPGPYANLRFRAEIQAVLDKRWLEEMPAGESQGRKGRL